MKTKSVLLIATIGWLFISLQTEAQPKPQNERMPPPPIDSVHIQKMMIDMSRALSLSKEQKTEISHIFYNQMNIEKKKHQKVEAKRILEREKIHTEMNQKIKALLTDDQETAFVLFKERHKPGHFQNKPKQFPNRP